MKAICAMSFRVRLCATLVLHNPFLGILSMEPCVLVGARTQEEVVATCVVVEIPIRVLHPRTTIIVNPGATVSDVPKLVSITLPPN